MTHTYTYIQWEVWLREQILVTCGTSNSHREGKVCVSLLKQRGQWFAFEVAVSGIEGTVVQRKQQKGLGTLRYPATHYSLDEVAAVCSSASFIHEVVQNQARLS